MVTDGENSAFAGTEQEALRRYFELVEEVVEDMAPAPDEAVG